MSNYAPPGGQTSPYSQPGYPPPPQPSGCGCGGCLGKFFLLLGVVFFVMIAVCCGGVFYLQSYLKNSITQQPADVQAISDEVSAIRVPNPPLAPAFGGRFKAPFSETVLGEGAVYLAPNKKAMLVVASFRDSFGPQFKVRLQKTLEVGPNQQGAAENDELGEELKNVAESTIERTIRGEAATFHVSEGTGVQSGKKKLRVDGSFQGKTGPAIFVIMGEEATLSRKQVDEIIQSIDGDAKAEKK